MILIYSGQSPELQFFLHNCVICLSKFNLLSISNTSNLTLFSKLMFISFIFIEARLFCWFFMSIIMAWNLSGFTIIMFSLNHCTAFSDSEVKLLINFSRDYEVHEIALSSAKLCNSAFSIQSQRSLIKMLKRTGPKIDPCRTPDNETWKTLYVLFIFICYFLSINKKKCFR